MIVLHWLPSKMSNITRYHCAKLLIHFILIVPAHLRPEGCFFVVLDSRQVPLDTGFSPVGYPGLLSSFELWTYIQKFPGKILKLEFFHLGT